MKKKYIKKKKTTKLVMYAPVDPQYVKSIEPVLGREIDLEKLKEDNEDYNLNLVSRTIDRGVRLLMEAGLKNTAPLDLVKLLNDHMRHLAVENDQEELDNAIKNKNYFDFMYDHRIESDLRAYFLLQTSIKDTFKGLMEELDTHIIKYMSEKDWHYLKLCIKKAESRIFKEKIKFVMPIEGYEMGDKVNMSPEEQVLYGFEYDENFYYDYRIDGHDLLALKELVEIVKGKEVHPLSIGPGFFLKYMPEITKTTHEQDSFNGEWFFNNELFPNEIYEDEKGNLVQKIHKQDVKNDERVATSFTKEDYDNYTPDSIIFKVNNKTKKLEKIEFAQVPAQRYEVRTGIFLAAVSLHFKQTIPELKRLYGVKNLKISDDELVDINSLSEDLQNNDFVKSMYKNFQEQKDYMILIEHFNKKMEEINPQDTLHINYLNDYSYYVCVPSQVSGPDVETAHYRYDKYSKNTNIIRAGECYLFEKTNDNILTTRLYFYPYKPSQVHPMLQHGSVIFGHNDMSYHPCKADGSVSFNNELNDFVRDYLIDEWTVDENNREFYQEPIFTMALFVDYLKKYGQMTKNPTELLKPENVEILIKVCEGRYAFSRKLLTSTDMKSILGSFQSHKLYAFLCGIYPVIDKLLVNFYPYNERFAVWDYSVDFKGISPTQMETFFKHVAIDMNNERVSELLNLLYKNKTIKPE